MVSASCRKWFRPLLSCSTVEGDLHLLPKSMLGSGKVYLQHAKRGKALDAQTERVGGCMDIWTTHPHPISQRTSIFHAFSSADPVPRNPIPSFTAIATCQNLLQHSRQPRAKFLTATETPEAVLRMVVVSYNLLSAAQQDCAGLFRIGGFQAGGWISFREYGVCRMSRSQLLRQQCCEFVKVRPMLL